MKKMLCAFLMVLTVLSYAACGSEMNNTEKPTQAVQAEYAQVPETTCTLSKLPEDYLFQIPNLSFPLKKSISVIWDRSYEEATLGKAVRDTVFGDTELQTVARDIVQNLNLKTVSGCLEYANALLPHAEAAGYFDPPEKEWILDFIVIYEDGVCSANYEDDIRAENYAEMSEHERRRVVRMDGGISVDFSMADGHIIRLEEPFHMLEGKEPYFVQEESLWSTYPNPMLSYLSYSDVSMPEHFTGWTGLYEAEKYEGAPLETSHHWDDATLQQNTVALTEGLLLFTAEGMAEYAKRLGEFLTESEYQICLQDNIRLTRYTDGAWEITYRTDDTELCVFVSESDGHIIHMIFNELEEKDFAGS